MKREDLKNMPVAQPKKGKGLDAQTKTEKKKCC